MGLEKYSFLSCIQELLKRYKREEIFLRAHSSLGFTYNEIYKVIEKEGGCEVFVNFLGLQGGSSELPSYILDLLAKNDDGGEGWSLYFDFFNNHLLWLLYDVMVQKNYAKAIQEDFKDTISKILFSLLGFRGGEERARAYLRFSPLLINPIRSKKHVQKVLQEAFGLQDRLRIVENLPHKTPIAPKQRNKLGGANSKLAVNFILGKTSLSYQTKIGIVIENLQYHEAVEFFPTGQKYKALKDIVEFLTQNEFAIDLYLKFIPELIFRLGEGARLGWGSTLGERKEESLVVLTLHE